MAVVVAVAVLAGLTGLIVLTVLTVLNGQRLIEPTGMTWTYMWDWMGLDCYL